jgi:ribosomal protein L22
MRMNALTKRMASMAFLPTTSTSTSITSIRTTSRLFQTGSMWFGNGSSSSATATAMMRPSVSSLSLGIGDQPQQQKQQGATRSASSSTTATRQQQQKQRQEDTFSVPLNTIITDPFGKKFVLSDLIGKSTSIRNPNKKVPPKVVRKRLEKLKTYEGKQKNIRHSPWRLQLICRHVAGMPLSDALTQLEFLDKRMAPLVQTVLKRTSNLADIRHGIPVSQLEIAECFATPGSHMKRNKVMGRGRFGVMHHKVSHLRVVLREIDFCLKLYQSRTPSEQKGWVEQYMMAQRDYDAAKTDRDALDALERMAAMQQQGKTTTN